MIARPLLILVCGCALAGPVVAGSLNAPAAPDAAGSAMYTLQDLYNRLNAGTAGVPRPSAFAEPAAGLGSTMRTLTEIMNKMPALNDKNGATAADVLAGKTFWGLTGGAWGLQTGSMATQTVNPATTSQIAGYYNAFNLATVDTDLTPLNIKKDVVIFGVTGTLAAAAVPKTGQTTSYATGDDGALQKGAVLPNPRFTDNGNGTVTDNLTGLIWLKNANCATATRNWAIALSDVANLNSTGTINGNSCGDTSKSGAHQTDWRLPNVRELFSLSHFAYSVPALSNTAGSAKWAAGDPFVGLVSAGYWSSTTDTSSSVTAAWVVDFPNGDVSRFSKTNNRFVWPVRGGQ